MTDYDILGMAFALYLSLYLLKMYITFAEIGWMVKYVLSGTSKKLTFKTRSEQRRYAFSLFLVLATMGTVFNFLAVIPLLYKERSRFFAFTSEPFLRAIAEDGQNEDED